jgi:MFS family permease
MRPLRWVTYAALSIMFLLGLADATAGWLAPVAYLIAAAITVADNGLSFTAVAEIAGPFWSGRALGMQNTSQFLAASIVAPGVGALIGLVGYPLAFALVGLAPAVALPLVPRADEHAPEPEPAAAR